MKTFTDERGTITDLLVTPEYSITHITFADGAVRGNHYHAQTEQVDLITKGKLLVSLDGNEFEVVKGDRVEILPNVKHAYKALQESEMTSFCWGIRKGEDYEKDVIRLDTPLL